MKHTTIEPKGLGKLERQRLSLLLRNTHVTLSVAEASDILSVPRTKAAKLLAAYAQKGWLTRVYSGVYMSVPIESSTNKVIPEAPFAIAEKLFSPCYITGWSAAEHWGMTEQIFQSVVVITQRRFKNYQPIIQGIEYVLHFSKPSTFFGLRSIWQSNVKVQIAGPTRLVVDLMNNPSLGGGLRPTVDIFKYYMSSSEKSIDLLITHLKQLSNGAAYKRLGFLVEKYYPSEQALISQCKKNLTTGNAKLDSTLRCNKLATKWRLWVPENWK